MPDRKIALWLLNRAMSWGSGPMIGALRGGFLGIGGNEVIPGQRGTCDPCVLMYEGTEADEYFIPIPVKCIGNPALLSPGNITDFQNILGFYSRYFSSGGKFPWQRYWEPPQPKDIFPDLKMTTPTGVGYYKALQDFTAQHPGYRHILVGYSQGGLVARYLAYMDEYLFGNALIDGIVTIESPNFGSPLARTQNADNMMENLLMVMAGFGQLSEGKFNGFSAMLQSIVQGPQRMDVDWVLELLEKALRDQGSPKVRYALNQQSGGNYGYLETARKWLSGFDNRANAPFAREESAFCDLDITLTGQAFSVLNSVNANPLQKIKHAAIIGSDNQLDQFVESGILEFVNDQGFFAKAIYGLINGKVEDVLRGFLAIAGFAYTKTLYEQGINGQPDIVLDRIRDFFQGVVNGDPRYKLQTPGLNPLAHDFIIPSAYQLIENPSDAFLGNWINPDSSHLSGGDINLAGRKNRDILCGILKKM